MEYWRRKKATKGYGPENEIDVVPKTEDPELNGAMPKESKSKRKDRRQSKKNKKEKLGLWYTSEPTGGRLLACDPIFADEEKFVPLQISRLKPGQLLTSPFRYLIASYAHSVHIYSTSTSLLVRSLPISVDDRVTAYALSNTNPNRLYIATHGGSIILWDWMHGDKLGRWELGVSIRFLQTAANEAGSNETVFTYEEIEGSYTVSAHRLKSEKEAKKTELQVIMKRDCTLQGFQVHSSGKYVLTSSGNRFILGVANKTDVSSLKDLVYTWREIKLITDCVFRSLVSQMALNPKKYQGKSGSSRDSVNTVFGGLEGEIFVFEDLLAKLKQAEDGKTAKVHQQSALAPRVLHWHREAANTVRWSRDGTSTNLTMERRHANIHRKLHHLWWQ